MVIFCLYNFLIFPRNSLPNIDPLLPFFNVAFFSIFSYFLFIYFFIYLLILFIFLAFFPYFSPLEW